LEKSQKLIELTADNPEIQFFHDQSAINAHLAGDWHPVSLKWNWQTLAFATRLVDKFDPNILHFIAQTKPWVQPSVPFTRKYWPQYEAFFANSCGAPKGKASYSSFSPKRDFTVKERFKNELSFQKQLNRINVLNPLAYTKLNGIIPAYRKSLHIRKIENAIISGGQIWPLNDAVDKKL
jgi:lipopolysaccharide biosynthesis glycosyltransferase